MNITLSVASQKNSKKSKIQLKFDRLWTQVKKKQKRNDKFSLEMDELVQVYNQSIAPKEKENELPLCALLEKLTTFYSRKSLALWQRDELRQWFHETLDELAHFNSPKAMLYMEEFKQVFADFHDISDQEMQEHDDNMAEELAEIMAEASANQGPNSQDDTFSCDDESATNNASDTDAEFDYEQFFEDALKRPNPAARNTQLMNEKWIRNLFRRTARALHPDKEQDAQKRAHKQALMSELLDARDKQDVMTMMLMYNQHVDDSELALAEDEMHSLCDMLEEQKYQLDAARDDIVQQSPLYEMLHANLHSASKKTRERNINEYLASVQEGIEQQLAMVAYLRNLTRLKAVLEERVDRYEPMGW
ncbi:MAG: hypothetical protein RPR98_04005 [Bermanella sp.]